MPPSPPAPSPGRRGNHRYWSLHFIFPSYATVMAMATQFTSNGLITDLVVHKLISFTAFQLHWYRALSRAPQIFIGCLFLPSRHLNTVPAHAQLLYIPIYHIRAVPCRVARLLLPNRTGHGKIVPCERGIRFVTKVSLCFTVLF